MGFTGAVVVETRQLTPRLRRIALQVDDPAVLAVPAVPDAAVGVYFTGLPDTVGRNYSVRGHDDDHITVDVVLHSGGPGTEWARAANPGDRVGLDHARSWYRPAPATQWQVLATDLTGLPAAARILEELPAAMPVTVLAEIVDDADLTDLPDRDHLTVISRVGTGNGYAPTQLAEMLSEIRLAPGAGYCWFAGEAGAARAARKHLRGLGWRAEDHDITGYWRQDSESWDTRYAEVADALYVVYARAKAAGKSEKAAAEEFDEALERAGL